MGLRSCLCAPSSRTESRPDPPPKAGHRHLSPPLRTSPSSCLVPSHPATERSLAHPQHVGRLHLRYSRRPSCPYGSKNSEFALRAAPPSSSPSLPAGLLKPGNSCATETGQINCSQQGFGDTTSEPQEDTPARDVNTEGMRERADHPNLPSPNPNPSTPHFPSSPKQKSAITRPITLQNL